MIEENDVIHSNNKETALSKAVSLYGIPGDYEVMKSSTFEVDKFL